MSKETEADARIAELEAKLAKVSESLEDVSADYNDAHREKLELEAKLAKAEAFIQSCVGGSVYSAVDSFAKPHEAETSRLARATLAELKGD